MNINRVLRGEGEKHTARKLITKLKPRMCRYNREFRAFNRAFYLQMKNERERDTETSEGRVSDFAERVTARAL